MDSQRKLADLVHNGIDSMLRFGLPIEKGLLWRADQLELLVSDSKLIFDACVTGFWDDQSIRWLEVAALVTKSGPISYRINERAVNKELAPAPINTLPSLPENKLYQYKNLSISVSAELKLADTDCAICMDEVLMQLRSGQLVNLYSVSGRFLLDGKRLLLSGDIQENTITGELTIEIRIHNPSAAAHPGGKWDLGDKNSVRINDFSVIFDAPSLLKKRLLDEHTDTNPSVLVKSEDFTIKQYGSGGEHWQSPIHWNEFKKSTVEKQGFELFRENSEVLEGRRANPTLQVNNDESFFQIALDGFWQNFPITLTSNKTQHKWQLFSEGTELQGGESKTWLFRCRAGKLKDINGEAVSLVTKERQPELRYYPKYINDCNVFPHISLSENPTPLSDIINYGVDGSHNFFNKRENKDVYGWRHYGELDADHESVNAPADTYFISHYNNQYDPLMGMTIQYLHSGNPKWLSLIQPLNQHIQDIDIYDTTQDKGEFNGGLMWHTDHYLSAETCTHRSNSINHEHAYEGFLGGGGPGGQHCYTSGLKLQYRLFADQSAKLKVQQLCDWVRNFYNGSGSIAERTFRLLTIDLKNNTLTNIGIKAGGYKYPLDRGTGNYLNALIDCFDLTEDPALLNEMGAVLRGTFHPNDDLSKRDLKNIEKSWFYTVYLQAVVRYLFLKESRNLIDDDYWFARHALMHYAEWMLNNESFYLSNAEQLEFPNDTWCAQDTRKMNLFCYFHYFNNTKSSKYLEKASKYYHYIVEHLTHSKEAQFTRILALLMQNDGVVQKFGLAQSTFDVPTSAVDDQQRHYGDAPSFSAWAIIKTYCRDILKLLRNFSFTLEWRWLVLRAKSVLNK